MLFDYIKYHFLTNNIFIDCIFFVFLEKLTSKDYTRRLIMNIEKHLKITGNSEISWKDAVVKAINEASKTIDYLSTVTVVEQRARIDGNKIVEYFVDLDLSFTLDLNRKDG